MKFAAGRFSRPLQPVKTGRHTKRQGVRIDLLLIAGLLGLMLIGTIAGPLAYRALSAPEHGPLPATPSQPAFVLSTGNEKAIADLRARMDAADASAVKYRALEASFEALQGELAIANSRISALEQAVISNDPTISQNFSPSK